MISFDMRCRGRKIWSARGVEALGLAAIFLFVACKDPPPPPARAEPSFEAALAATKACLGPTFMNVPYAKDKRTKLDVFLPKAPRQLPVPWVMWIHGGGWAGGTRESVATFALRQTCRGYAVVSVDYRLSFEARYPAALSDLRAALRFVQANATTYELDGNNVILWGASAGAHLASLMALTAEQKHLDRPDDPHRKRPMGMRGVIAWWTPASFAEFDADFDETCPQHTCHTCLGSPESRFLGCEVKSCLERARRASPVTWVHAKAPPFLLQHGSHDCTVPVAQSHRFAEALRKAGASVELQIVPGGRHGDGSWLGSAVRAAVDGFIDRTVHAAAVSDMPVPPLTNKPAPKELVR